MSKIILSGINIYPVKSLGGISLPKAEVTDRGLKYDRRWMVIDSDENFITQRSHPQMALIKTKINGSKLILNHKTKNISPLVIPINIIVADIVYVNVWDDLVEARPVGKYADEWLSEALELKCRLVYMADESFRLVNKTYASNNEIVSFADAYPFLGIGLSSLNDLNLRLEEKLPMNRFRPNFEFSGSEPYEEDRWKKFRIGEVIFYGVKQCSRCVVTTVDQENAEMKKEPLKTLAQYRTVNNNVMFGMNLLHDGIGVVNVGDEIEILEWKNDEENS